MFFKITMAYMDWKCELRKLNFPYSGCELKLNRALMIFKNIITLIKDMSKRLYIFFHY